MALKLSTALKDNKKSEQFPDMEEAKPAQVAQFCIIQYFRETQIMVFFLSPPNDILW